MPSDYVPQLEEDAVQDWIVQSVDTMDKGANFFTYFLCRERECLPVACSLYWLRDFGD